MAHRSSLYRVCGPALVGSGVLLAASFALRPHLPVDLAAAAEIGLGPLVLANWMMMIGAVLLLGGWIGLTEHLNDTIVEGWSTLGLGGIIIGSVGLAVAAAISAEALPRLLETYTNGSSSAASQSYATVAFMMRPLALTAWTILWVGAALTGLALAEDAEYPAWLGYSGLLLAVLQIVAQLLTAYPMLRDSLGMLGSIWIAAVGMLFTRIDRRVPIPENVAEPAAMT